MFIEVFDIDLEHLVLINKDKIISVEEIEDRNVCNIVVDFVDKVETYTTSDDYKEIREDLGVK